MVANNNPSFLLHERGKKSFLEKKKQAFPFIHVFKVCSGLFYNILNAGLFYNILNAEVDFNLFWNSGKY